MHVAVDLNWFLRFIGFAFAAAFGLLYLVRNTASRYFVVDSNFDSSAADYSLDQKKREDNMGAPVFLDSCVVCGLSTTKQCAGCKMVKYCSGACQKSHWNSEHKAKCEELRYFYRANHENSASVSRRMRASVVPLNGSSKMFEPANKVLFPYEDFVKLFNRDKLGYTPCGLINCGNSCFANVVLQCLAYTRPLVAYLLEKGHRIECLSVDWCFFCEFQTHVERVSQSVRPFSPINILSRLPNIGANFGYGKQEDAHEFMRFAIDNMQSACLNKFGGEKAVHPRYQETTLIQHIFGGRLQSQVVCTECNNVSNQFENMMDLTVEIHGDAESLEECLDQFTAKEQLHGDNMYKCDGCNAYVTAWKHLLIQRAPNILTIALKRFQSGRFGKLNKKVSFSETLDLRAYMSESEDGNDVYKLYAVIVHVDMLNASFFGHYICYVKDFRGNWYRIDDCKVESVDLDEVLSQRAYMLLYSRICARASCLLPDESLRKEVNKNLKIQEIIGPCEKQPTAECSTSASECLDNSIDLEQQPSTSGFLIKINSEEEMLSSSSISDAEGEKGDISERNLPVFSSLVAVEDASKTDAASESCIFEEGKNMCGGVLESVISHSTSSMLENVEFGDNCSPSSYDDDIFRKSYSASFAPRLKPIFAPGFLGKRPQKKVNKRRYVATIKRSSELLPNRSHLSNQTNEIEIVGVSEPNLPVIRSEELSTAPEDVSPVSQHNNGPHLTINTFSSFSDASQGSIIDASGGLYRKLPEESHASQSCTFEDGKSTCNNFSASDISNGEVLYEVNLANSTFAYKNASLENGSTSSDNIQAAIKKSALESPATKLKCGRKLLSPEMKYRKFQ